VLNADQPTPPVESRFDQWGETTHRPEGLERWAIEIDPSGECVIAGSVSAHQVWYGPNQGSMAINIGISLRPEFRGSGIAQAAVCDLVAQLHDRGIARVEASIDVDNTPAQRLLSRCGFTYEGVARGAQVRADGRHDLQIWSHLQVTNG